jgi:hypothetical protein
MSAVDQTKTLERSYREALRWYPKGWRRRNEDAVLGTLLDAAEEDHRSVPARGELANLRANGLGERIGFVGRVLPSSVRSRTGVWMLGLGVAISLVGLLFAGWTFAQVDGTYRQVWTLGEFAKNIIAGQGLYLVWVAAGIGALFGARRVALWIAVATIPVSIAWPVIAWYLSQYGHPSGVTIVFLDLVAIVAVAGLASPQPRLRERTALWSGVGVTFVFGFYFLRIASGGYFGNGAQGVDAFWAPLAVWMVFLGLPLALVAASVLALRGQSHLAGSILWSAAPVFPLIVIAWGWQEPSTALADVVIATIIVIAIVAMLVLRSFGFKVTITRA